MSNTETVDQAYAKLTVRAQRQRQVWEVSFAETSGQCASRLTEIAASGGLVFQIVGRHADEFDIIWWHWED